MENIFFEMKFLSNVKLQQMTRVFLLIILVVIVLLFLETKVTIYKKEREKEDRK